MTDQPTRPVTEDERALLQHVSRWGSDGYPVQKLKSRWTWGPWRSVKGPPTTFRTKREATASFELFLDLVRIAIGREALDRAKAQLAANQLPPGGAFCSEPECFNPTAEDDLCGFHSQQRREAEELE